MQRSAVFCLRFQGIKYIQRLPVQLRMILVCRSLRIPRSKLLKRQNSRQQLSRNVTALYITGDKAKETYATLQPYLEFAKIYDQRKSLEFSIEKRGLQNKINLTEISSQYEVYKKFKAQIDQLECARNELVMRLRQLTSDPNTKGRDIETLKSQGKQLREEQRTLRETLYPIEDEFAHAYLDIPNTLHSNCAIDGNERVIYRYGMLPAKQDGQNKSHIERSDLFRFINNDRFYMFKEAAKFDVFAAQALTRYFVEKGEFLQTANPDFVRCVLLEANSTPLEQYHRVIEVQLQNQLNCAYLAGGASFESYLAAVTRLSVYPSVLPLRYICTGRIYEKTNPTASKEDRIPNLFTATQSNAVQTFVATESPDEANDEFERILNLAVDFYKSIGIHFRIIYEDATKLIASERLRASIEVYSPNEQRYICIGRLSNFGDYVSKRILFCMRRKKDYNFLNLVGGPILYTTRLIAALVENKLPLNHDSLLGAYKPNVKPSAIEEFKDLFK